VRRELGLAFAQPQGEMPRDPLDRTMIRGRIDVLVPIKDRCLIIDYKTDRFEATEIDRQVEHHRGQIALYAQAMESLLHLPVEGYLAFLTMREWRALNLDSTTAAM